MNNLKNAVERLFWIAGCLAVLALPGAAEMSPAAFEWNQTDLRAAWGGLKSEAATMATPPARAIYVCRSCGMDSEVYSRVLHYRCNGGGYINDIGARDIAKRAAGNTIDVEAFLNAYYQTCNSNTAVEVGEGNRSGALSAEVYSRVLHYRCSGDGYINDIGARDIAKRAAKASIKLDVFLNVYYQTCSFDSAVEVACRPRKPT